MNLEHLVEQFELVTNTEEGLVKLRKVILNQAVGGNLTKQDPKDEPAEKLLERIEAERQRRYEIGDIRKPKNIEPFNQESIPYELPNSWVWANLGDVILEIYGGSTPSKSNPSFWEGDICWASVKDLDDDEIYLKSTQDKITEKGLEETKFVPAGNVIVCTRMGLGKINLNTVDTTINQDLKSIILPGELSQLYFYYYYKSLNIVGSGMTVSGIKQSELLRLPFALPSKEEQQRIVQKIETLFSQVDELEQKVQQDRQVDERLQVAVLDDLQSAETPEASKQSWQRLTDHFEQIYHKPEHIDQLKQAILNEAVRGRLVPQDPNDEPAVKLLERIKEEKQRLYEAGEIRKPKDLDPVSDDEMPYELPNQWCWARIGTACSISGGKRVPKGYSLQDAPTPYIYIRVTDMKEGTVLDGDLKYISKEVKSQISKYTISKDDLYITIAGTIGDVGSIPEEFDGMNLTENAAKIQLYLLNKDYLQKVLNSPVVQTQFFEKVNKMAQPKLALKRIRSTIFPLPPLEEQERIIEKVEELFTWCDDLKDKLSRSQQTDQRLLEALVNGHGEDEQVDSEGKS